MKTVISIIAALAASATAIAIPFEKRAGSISVTPHDLYASSIGVLGCKINTNRVAYFPSSPSCDNMCIKVSSNGRSVHLLKIDQSGGAFDIAYDAWNYLKTGESALVNPQEGGGISASYEDAPMSECADLIKTEGGKLAFSAPNSVGFVASCGASTWVGKNAALFNIQDSACTLGVDEVCNLDMSVSNQPSCPSGLGSKAKLSSDPVYNIIYGSGKRELAA